VMSGLKFCANLTTMFLDEEEDLIKRYSAAAKAGFKGVETPDATTVPLDAIVAAKEASGMEQVHMNTHPLGISGIAATPGKEEAFKENLLQALDYCKALKCKRLHIQSGFHPGSEETLISNLRWSLDKLKEANVIGIIEPINKYTKPNYVVADYDLGENVIS